MRASCVPRMISEPGAARREERWIGGAAMHGGDSRRRTTLNWLHAFAYRPRCLSAHASIIAALVAWLRESFVSP